MSWDQYAHLFLSVLAAPTIVAGLLATTWLGRVILKVVRAPDKDIGV